MVYLEICTDSLQVMASSQVGVDKFWALSLTFFARCCYCTADAALFLICRLSYICCDKDCRSIIRRFDNPNVRSSEDSTLTLSLIPNPKSYHRVISIKTSATSINMEEPQPQESQNRIIEPSDCRTLGLLIHYRDRIRYFHCLCRQSGVATVYVVGLKTRKFMRFAEKCRRRRGTWKRKTSCTTGLRWHSTSCWVIASCHICCKLWFTSVCANCSLCFC